MAIRLRFQRAVTRNDLIPVKGHFRTETSSLALCWWLFPARSQALMTQLFTLFWLLMHSNSSYLISALQTAEGFLIHFTTLHPKSAAFRADPCLILSHTPRWARLTYDSVSLLEHGCAIFSCVSAVLDIWVICYKSADVWLVCHRCHKQRLLFFGGVLTPQPGELWLRSAKNCFVCNCAFFQHCRRNYRTEMDTFNIITLPFLFVRPSCQMPTFISWAICWDECQTSKVNVKWIVQWDALGSRPSGSTTYKREHLIFECILDFPSPNVHDSIRHPLVQRQSSLYQ